VSDPARRGGRTRARRRPAPLLVRLLVVAAAFALGAALGAALDDAPRSEQRTYVRTLQPATLAPIPETVTVTVSAP
jgi:hypothetical protein